MKGMILRGMRAASDILLPRLCIVCGRRLLLDEKHLCLDCLADLPQTYFWTMSHNPMADKLNAIIQEQMNRGDSYNHENYAFAAALFFYHSEADYRLIPYQIKYHGNISAGRFFGKMLGRRLASSDIYSDVDLVIPVPLHWTRKWKRGYNQAEVIASGAADALGVPMRTDVLKRQRRTTTQTKIDVENKHLNVADAFSADGSACTDLTENGIRHILLIDDIFTTGNTSCACFHALRILLPSSVRISVATLGFVGH